MLLSSTVIHKGHRQGRPVPQFLLSSEERKCSKKGGAISAKLCAVQRILCVQDTKYKQSKVQQLPAGVRKVLVIRSPESKCVKFFLTYNCQRREPKQNLAGRPSGDFRIHKLEKNLLVVRSDKRSILHDSVKCVLYIRSEVKLETFVNSTLCFTKGLVFRNTIQ